VLGVLPRAEKVATSVAMTVIPYNLLELVRLLITETKGVLLDEEYAGEITLTIRFRDEQVDLFTGRLNDLSRGAVNVIIVERQSNTIMPL
jgi:putative IMPACT (imprinted ancient) family translation regulator